MGNIKTVVDNANQFGYGFNSETGQYYRTGIFNDEGQETERDPFMASFPHLLDIGIMGHCDHGLKGLCKVGCYQSGLEVRAPNMTLEDYKDIIDACEGKLHQVALGGRGDPNQHTHFEEIIAYSREKGIVPNLTTSGFGLTDDQIQIMKRYCGAVAVSWYRSAYTVGAINRLTDQGVKTNIHYILSRDTIDEAYERLVSDLFPQKVNRVIFLLHKPIGLGKSNQVLNINDKMVQRFFALFNEEQYANRVGFDSCSVPGLINLSPNIHWGSVDTCEGARYSAYISSDLVMTPCSFDQNHHYGVSLRDQKIEEVWESIAFRRFRSKLKMACPTCDVKQHCLGGCPLASEIVLCNRGGK